jgi:mono/diheme cytochrome c family protein
MGRDGNPDLLLPMSPYDEASVSDADLEAIFAWLDSQPMPMTGQGLYADLCANCHGVDADGVPEKDLLALLDKIPAAVRSGFNPDQMANAAEYMPAWTAEQLTDAQIQLIVGYLTAVAAQ